MNMVTLYDIQEQYIAFSAPMPEVHCLLSRPRRLESVLSQVSEVFFEWGAFFVLAKNGKLFRLQEKATQDRLHILFKSHSSSSSSLQGSWAVMSEGRTCLTWRPIWPNASSAMQRASRPSSSSTGTTSTSQSPCPSAK